MIKEMIARNIYEPLYYNLYRRDGALDYFKRYSKAQHNTISENKKIQAKRLFALLKYSIENISYYAEVARRHKIELSENTVFSDLSKFPALTKDIIRDEFNNLHNVGEDTKWYYNTSGGSTGEPVRFIQDRNFEAESEAITRMQYEWAGFRPGDSFIQLWGSKKDILKQKENQKHKFALWIRSTIILDAFRMDEKKMNSYVDAINKTKPRIILAYAQSINELANHIKLKNLKVFSPKAIFTSANVLQQTARMNIEETFRCPVFNRYGSREVGNIACECEKQEGLHYSIFTHYIEILNDKMEPCRDGESGDIYVTLLTNYSMPLIRYKIGDIATYTETECSCGRGLPIIKEIVGRDNDVFITSQGEKIHTGIINMQFYFRDFIKKYQAIQKAPDLLIIKIVPKENSASTSEMKFALEEIKSNLQDIMGKDCRIGFEIVDSIEETKSGKYRYTIREF